MTLENYIRPSALESVALCPAMPLLSAAVVDAWGEPPEDGVTEDGSLIHGQIAAALTGAEHDPLPAKLQWKADACIDFAREVALEHGVDEVDILVEHHVDGAGLGLRKGGTIDVLLSIPAKKRVVIIDWKTGFLDQGDADDHDQTLGYAIMAAATFKAEEAIVILFCPSLPRAQRRTVARIDLAGIRSAIEWVRAVTSSARQPNPSLNPSYLACRHCRALIRCPAARKAIMDAHQALAQIGNPTDSDQWGDMIAFAKLAKAFAEQVDGIAKPYMKDGGVATGWHLSPSGTMTKIDASLAIELASKAGALPALLEYATFKTGAAEHLAGIIDPAVTKEEKQPSIKPDKGELRRKAGL